MEPKSMFVLELFAENARYLIPLYQRRYVWTRARQWEPLWGDIRAKAEALLAQDEEIHPHFLGAVVVKKLKVPYKQVEAYDVIDGQQRLTTFQMFLAAFRDSVRTVSDDLTREATAHLVNSVREGVDRVQRFKVWPTRFDQPVFKRVIEHADAAQLAQEVTAAREAVEHVPTLAAAHVYFAEELGAWLAQGDPAVRAEALWEALAVALQVVRIDLSSRDDPQVIFETLNARGAPLEPADLVRNHIFSDAAHQDAPVDELFTEYWARFDEDGSFWRKKATRGRVTRDQLTWFLAAFLTVQQTREVPDSALFEAFKTWWDVPGRSVEERLQVLTRHADAYSAYMQAAPDTRLGVFRRRLEAMDIGTLTPVALWLLTSAGLTTADLTTVLGDLESFTVRRFVVGLSNKNYNQLFLGLLRTVQPGPELPAHIHTFLERASGDSVRWPADAEVHAALTTDPTYTRIRPRGVGMLLEAIEMDMTSSKQEKLLLAAAPSIEHVLPRQWRRHWPAPPAREGIADPAAFRDARLHNLGNLTLITQALNSSVSNGPYADKQAEVLKHTVLRLNDLFREHDHWDEDAIEQRAHTLAARVLTIWPAPVQRPGEATAVDDVAEPARPTGTLDAVVEGLLATPPPGFTVEPRPDGALLLMRGWSRSIKLALVQRDTPDSETVRLEARDDFGADQPEKAGAQLTVQHVAERAVMAFNEQEVTFDGSVVSVEFGPAYPAARLQQAVARMVLIVVTERQRHWRRTKAREQVHELLDALPDDTLPDGFYLMGDDAFTPKPYRRIAHALWRSDVHLELSWDTATQRCRVALDLEDGQGAPVRSAVAPLWPTWLGRAQADLPGAEWITRVPDRGQQQLRATLPAGASLADIQDALRVLARIVAPTVTGQHRRAFQPGEP